MKIKGIFKLGLTTSAAVALIFGSAGIAQASQNSTAASTDADCPQCTLQANAPDRSRSLEGVKRSEMISAVKADLDANLLKFNVDNTELHFSEAIVLEVAKGGDYFKTVTIPITGYSPISNFTVAYNSKGQIDNYAETLYTKSDNGNFKLDQWVNGKLTQSKELNLPYISDSELQTSIEQLKSESEKAASSLRDERSFGKVVTCLTTLTGVGGPLAYLIVSACAGACVAPEPTVTKGICTACIGAYAVIGAGGMGAAAACFQLW